MSIRSGIYDLLKALEADSYPIVAPQETTASYVTYSMRQEPVRTQDGISPTDVELTLNVFSNTLSDAVTLAGTMYAGLEAASGTYGARTLMVCNWIAESESYIPELDKYMITQEYQLRFA